MKYNDSTQSLIFHHENTLSVLALFIIDPPKGRLRQIQIDMFGHPLDVSSSVFVQDMSSSQAFRRSVSVFMFHVAFNQIKRTLWNKWMDGQRRWTLSPSVVHFLNCRPQHLKNKTKHNTFHIYFGHIGFPASSGSN